MSTVAVVGSQWGDEGKGKAIDFLATQAEYVVRAQGGSNAGHSVVIGGKKYALHLIPSGILNPDAKNIIGNGVAFDPEAFFRELDGLQKDGIDTSQLYISDRAHIVFPYHKVMDALTEKAKGSKKVGTTNKGIGPCYMDKMARIGIRCCDMLDDEVFREKLSEQVDAKNDVITKLYGEEPLDKEAILTQFCGYAEKLKPYITDTIVMINKALESGAKVLFEGAQGAMLDIDMGTYPYVTSSHPVSGGFASGAGVSPRYLSEIVGIVKAYTTRVGAGPFVSEEDNETGDKIREVGHEYGVTTGRPRRCGWLDLVALKYALMINGVTDIALTKADVMSTFDTINVCTAYKVQGKLTSRMPTGTDEVIEPVYTPLPGWKEDISHCSSYDALPQTFKDYIRYIEDFTGVKISIVSVGPDRNATIFRD